jgi:hypothetical protein
VSESERTRPSGETRAAEAEDGRVTAQADASPTSDEERAAERAEVDEEAAARSYKEAIERGADQQGEGRLI